MRVDIVEWFKYCVVFFFMYFIFYILNVLFMFNYEENLRGKVID